MIWSIEPENGPRDKRSRIRAEVWPMSLGSMLVHGGAGGEGELGRVFGVRSFG